MQRPIINVSWNSKFFCTTHLENYGGRLCAKSDRNMIISGHTNFIDNSPGDLLLKVVSQEESTQDNRLQCL